MNSVRNSQAIRALDTSKTKLIFIAAKPQERMSLLRRLNRHKKKLMFDPGDLIVDLGYRRLPVKQRKRILKILVSAERIGRSMIVENLYSRLPSEYQKDLPFPYFVWNRFIHIYLGLSPPGYVKLLMHLSNRCLKLHAPVNLA